MKKMPVPIKRSHGELLEETQRCWLNFKDFRHEKTELAHICEDGLLLAYEALDLVEALSAQCARLERHNDTLRLPRPPSELTRPAL